MIKVLLTLSAYLIIATSPTYVRAAGASAHSPENVSIVTTKKGNPNDKPAHVIAYLNDLASNVSSATYLRLPHLLEHLCTCALRNNMTQEQYDCFLDLLRKIPHEELYAIAQRPAGEQVKKFLALVQNQG